MKTKGRRQSTNVIDKTKEIEDILEPPELWAGGKANKKSHELDNLIKGIYNDRLRNTTPISEQNSDTRDSATGGNPGVQKDGVPITVRLKNLREEKEPQRILIKKTQVTPGKWKTIIK